METLLSSKRRMVFQEVVTGASNSRSISKQVILDACPQLKLPPLEVTFPDFIRAAMTTSRESTEGMCLLVEFDFQVPIVCNRPPLLS
jgi:hypothetical protein